MMVRLFTGGIYTVGVGCFCLGQGDGQVGSSFLLVFNQALTVKYSVYNKTQIRSLNHFITITISQLITFGESIRLFGFWQDFRLKKNFNLFVACNDKFNEFFIL